MHMTPPSDTMHLATHELFRQGNMRIYVNNPSHDGDVPLHDHDFFECALVCSGTGVHQHFVGQEVAQEGLLVWVPPGHWHAWKQCQDLQLLNCCLSANLLDHELAWSLHDPRLSHLWSAASVRTWHISQANTQRLSGLLKGLQAAKDHDHIASIGLVLVCLSALVDALPLADRGAQSFDQLVRDLRITMRRRLNHDWSLQELADEAGLEASYLGRRFRKATGLSPIQWLARQRCEQAAILLLTSDQPVADIGKHLGWSDPNYFARIFRRHFNCSPSTFRQQKSEGVSDPRCSHDNWLQW